MTRERTRSINPARVVSLVALTILLGSTARAEVRIAASQGSPAPVSPSAIATVASLALVSASRQATETAGIRIGLARDQAAARAAHLDRRAWNGAGARAAPSAGDSPAPTSGVSTHTYSADWYAVAACESGGAWHINSGNGYWGGLQFDPTTWFAYGGGPFDGSGSFPYSASEQIAVAERILADQGPGAWPNCFSWA
jgi:hypothetical protein